MSSNVNSICCSASLALRNIGSVRKYLSHHNTERLVYAFISSKLDYCNSLLVYGLPSTDIQKLQRIHNSAARLVVGTKRREHISPILYDLHWLPVRERIIFKVLLVTFKVAPYRVLKSGKNMFQTQNLVHWYFVRRMKLNIWYRTAFWELETVTKKCITVVAMATMTFQNGS